ncbi:MAG: hypothetical protein U0230_10345 [Polyangiales bacterium]
MALPQACAKCGNPPSGKPEFQSFRYHPPHVYFWALLGVVAYFVFGPLSTRVHPLYIHLCETHRWERERRRRFVALVIPASVLLGGAAPFVLDPHVAPWVILSVLVIVIGTSLAFRRVDEILRCTGMDDAESRFEGASPRLLDAPASPLGREARLVDVFS